MTLGPSYYGDDDYDDERSPSEYCKHGTFIGNWAGPDYMCGPCEDGISDAEWAEICKANEEHREAETGERMFWHALGDMCKAERAAKDLAQLTRTEGGFDIDGSWTEFINWIIVARKVEA